MQSSGIAPVLLPDITTLSIIGHRSQTTHLAAHPPHSNMQGAPAGKFYPIFPNILLIERTN